MYPYQQAPYGSRPDANMMAAYRQQHQQYYQQQQQQQQRGGGGQWNSNAALYPSVNHSSNVQGMGYPPYMGQHYPPYAGYPMQQQQQQQSQQPYGAFNAPANRQGADNGNTANMQPQRPGWAESRPGRTPCKDDWWSHVTDDMQFIDSPMGIDLEKEDEHANVMEELQRTGTTSGVVNEGEDTAVAFGDARGTLEPPFTVSTPPAANNVDAAAATDRVQNGAGVVPNGRQPGPSTAALRPPGPNTTAEEDAAAAASAGGTRSHNTHRRTSNADDNEEGKKKKHNKGRHHRRHSAKEGREAPPTEAAAPRARSPGDSAELGDSAFLPPAADASSTTTGRSGPHAPPPQQQQQQQQRQAMDKDNMSSPPAGAARGRGTSTSLSTSSPGGNAAATAEQTSLPRPVDTPANASHAFDDNFAGTNAPRTTTAVAAAKRGSVTADSPGHGVNGNRGNRLSNSESAVDSSGPSSAAASPDKSRRRDRRLYSYFNSRRPTAMADGDEDEAEERNSAAAYGSGSDEEDDESGSDSDEESDEEGDSDEDDEADYSTMRRTPDHGNNAGRSMLEYSAFHDMPGGGGGGGGGSAGMHLNGDSRGDFSAAIGDTSYPVPGPRRSGGGYGMGSLSGSGGNAMPSHKARLSHPNASITMHSTSTAVDDKAYMMADMSLMERNTNGQNRTYSIPAQRDEGQFYGFSKPSTPQHHQQRPPLQAHTLLKENTDVATPALTAARETKPGEAEGTETTTERMQRVGGARRLPPKITTRPSAINAAPASLPPPTAATATTTTTTTTLPSVQQQRAVPDGPFAAAAAAATASLRNEKTDTKLPPARAADKRTLPLVAGATRITPSAADKTTPNKATTAADNNNSTAKEVVPPLSGKPPMSSTAAALGSTAGASAATAAATASASAGLRRPAAPAALSSTVEGGRSGSGAAAKATPLNSGTAGRPSLLQRVRKPSGSDRTSVSPAGRLPPPSSPPPTAAAAAAGSPPNKKGGSGSPSSSLNTAPAAAARLAGTSGKALPLSRSPTQPQPSPLAPNTSGAASTTTSPSGAKGVSGDNAAALTRPPLVSSGKASAANTTASAGKPAAGASNEKDTSEPPTHITTTATATVPRSGQRQSTSSGPLQLSSNPLSLASSTSTGLAQVPVPVKKDAESRDAKSAGPSAPSQVRTGPSPSPLGAALGSGRRPDTQPPAVPNSDSVSAGRATTVPVRRPVAGSAAAATTSPLPVSAVVTSGKAASVNGGVNRQTPTASVETKIGTSGDASPSRGDSGAGGAGSGAAAAVPRRAATRVPGGPSPTPTAPSSPREAHVTPHRPSQAHPVAAAAAANTTASTAEDGDNDTRDAWMEEAYDFYAYSGHSLSEDDLAAPFEKPAASSAVARHGPTPPTSAHHGGAKRLSTTTGSLTDLGYIMF